MLDFTNESTKVRSEDNFLVMSILLSIQSCITCCLPFANTRFRAYTSDQTSYQQEELVHCVT